MNQAEQFAVKHFDKLPNSALVSVRVVEIVKGCGPTTVWRRIADGKLDAVRDGHMTRVTVASVRKSMQVPA